MTDQRWPTEDKMEYLHQRIDHLRNAMVLFAILVGVFAIYTIS